MLVAERIYNEEGIFEIEDKAGNSIQDSLVGKKSRYKCNIYIIYI